MHHVARGKVALKVGVDVERSECYELAAAPKDFAEELVRVVAVGEGDREEQEEGARVVTGLVEAKHHRRVRREVGKAGGEERAGELDRSPPPGDGPHAECVLHDDARRVASLGHGRRPTEDRCVELHPTGALQGLGWGLASSGEYMDCVSRRVERERGGINRAPNRSITMRRALQ